MVKKSINPFPARSTFILLLCIFHVFVNAAPALKKAQEREFELVQGDMLLPKKSILTPLSGLRDPNAMWPNAVVPYEMASDFSNQEQQEIRDAMAEIARKACVQFIPRVYEEDYVRIGHDGPGCFSNVGRIRGPQIVNLNRDGCVNKGIAIHELTHSLGFFHEQARPDRDDHVDIIWRNIEEDKKGQFEIMKETIVTTFNIGYDYGSIMHYGRYDFSKYGEQAETIRPKPYSDVPIGQRRELSAKDVLKIRRMYKMADYGSCYSVRGFTTSTSTYSPWSFPSNQWPDPWQPRQRPRPRPIPIPISRPVPSRPSWVPSWFPWW